VQFISPKLGGVGGAWRFIFEGIEIRTNDIKNKIQKIKQG
jgi:hypothetical protein